MSVQENLFLGTTSSVADEAAFLQELLQLEPIPDRQWASDDEIGLRGKATTVDGWLGFVVMPNDLVTPDPEPDEVQAIDGYPVEIDVWHGGRDELVQAREARLVFDRLVEARPELPLLLCHDVDFLIAAYLPGAGVHEFEPRTSMDEPDLETWRPWVVR